MSKGAAQVGIPLHDLRVLGAAAEDLETAIRDALDDLTEDDLSKRDKPRRAACLRAFAAPSSASLQANRLAAWARPLATKKAPDSEVWGLYLVVARRQESNTALSGPISSVRLTDDLP